MYRGGVPLYEIDEGTVRKYYRIELEGKRVRLGWGRIGGEGKEKVIEHRDAEAARREYERQILKRREHGYRLVVDEDVPHDRQAAREAERAEKLSAIAPLSTSPRFYFVHRKTRRFAWVEARNCDLLAGEGPVGGEAQAAPRTEICASPAAAARKRDAAVASLMAQGFTLESFAAAEEQKRRR